MRRPKDMAGKGARGRCCVGCPMGSRSDSLRSSRRASEAPKRCPFGHQSSPQAASQPRLRGKEGPRPEAGCGGKGQGAAAAAQSLCFFNWTRGLHPGSGTSGRQSRPVIEPDHWAGAGFQGAVRVGSGLGGCIGTGKRATGRGLAEGGRTQRVSPRAWRWVQGPPF